MLKCKINGKDSILAAQLQKTYSEAEGVNLYNKIARNYKTEGSKSENSLYAFVQAIPEDERHDENGEIYFTIFEKYMKANRDRNSVKKQAVIPEYVDTDMAMDVEETASIMKGFMVRFLDIIYKDGVAVIDANKAKVEAAEKEALNDLLNDLEDQIVRLDFKIAKATPNEKLRLENLKDRIDLFSESIYNNTSTFIQYFRGTYLADKGIEFDDGNFKKYSEDENSEVEALEATLDDAFTNEVDQTGRDFAFNKSSYVVNPQDNAPRAVKRLLYGIMKKDSNGKPVLNEKYGTIESYPFNEVFAKVADKLANHPPNIDHYIKLIKEIKNIGSNDIVRRLNGGSEVYNPGKLNTDNLNEFSNQFTLTKTRIAFTQLMGNNRYDFASILSNSRTKSMHMTNSNIDRTVNVTRRDFVSSYFELLNSTYSKKAEVQYERYSNDLQTAFKAKKYEKFFNMLGIKFSAPFSEITVFDKRVKSLSMIASTLNDEFIRAKFYLNPELFNGLYKGSSPVAGTINLLVQKEAKLADTAEELQHYNAENKVIYDINLNSYITTMSNIINANTAEELATMFPNLFGGKDGYSKNSSWIPKLLREGWTMKVGVLEGIISEDAKVAGKATKDLAVTDLYLQRITSVMSGYFPLMRAADRGVENFIRLIPPSGQETKTALVTGRTAFKKILKGYLIDEITASYNLINNGVGKDIEFYRENGMYLRLFSEFNKDTKKKQKRLIKDLYKKLNTLDDNKALDKMLEEKLDKIMNDEFKKMKSAKVFHKIKGKELGIPSEIITKFRADYKHITNEKEKTQLVYKAIAGVFAMNSVIANVEQSKILIGDIAQYKSTDDLFKRISMLNSTKGNAVVDNQTNEFIAQLDHYNTLQGDDVLPNSTIAGKIRSITIEDLITTKPEFIKMLTSIFEDALKEEGLSKTKRDAKIKAYIKPYTEINEADAQAYVTLDEYRRFLIRTGDWTLQQEKMYYKISRGLPYSKRELAKFTVLKPQYSGPLMNSSIHTIAGRKMSLIPLIPDAIKGTVLEQLNDEMNSFNVGMAFMSSAAKFGRKVNKKGKSHELYKDGKFGIDIFENSLIDVLDYRFMGIQLKISQEEKDMISSSTQKRKLQISNFFENGELIVQDDQLKKDIKDYISAQSNLVDTLFNELAERLGLDESMTITSENIPKIVNALQKNFFSRGLTSNSIAAIARIEDSMLIDSLAERQRVEYTIMSMFRNAVMTGKRTGTSLAQVSDVGFETEDAIGDDNLKFYEKKFDNQGVVNIPTVDEIAEGFDTEVFTKIANRMKTLFPEIKLKFTKEDIVSKEGEHIWNQMSSIEDQLAAESHAQMMDYFLNKRFKKATKFMDQTINKLENHLADLIGNNQRENTKNEPFAKKELKAEQIKKLEEVNQYLNEIPQLKSIPLLEQKFKKNPISLNNDIKLDGIKKPELKILNDVRGEIKENNSKLKSISVEDFANEVKNYLELNYLLGFGNENMYLDYRVGSTFTHPEGIRHNKVSLRFNNEYVNQNSHFPMSPSAWGNITYFDNGSLIDSEAPFTRTKQHEAGLIHEIQNDFFEKLQKFNAPEVFDPLDPDAEARRRNRDIKTIMDTSKHVLFNVKKYPQFLYNIPYGATNERLLLNYDERLDEAMNLAESNVKSYHEVNSKIDHLFQAITDLNDWWFSKKDKVSSKIQEMLDDDAITIEELFDEKNNKRLTASEADDLAIRRPLLEQYNEGLSRKFNKRVAGVILEMSELDSDPDNPARKDLRVPINAVIDAGKMKNPTSVKQYAHLFYLGYKNKILREINGMKKTKNSYKGSLYSINKYPKYAVLGKEDKLKIMHNINYNINMMAAPYLVDESLKENVKILDFQEQVSDKNNIENTYFEAIVHKLIQNHIKAKGKGFPLYFSGQQITYLTQGSTNSSYIYAGPEEVAKGLAPKVGTLFVRMNKMPGIKLEYVERIDGFVKSVGGYKVNLDDYNYETPLLYQRDAVDRIIGQADVEAKSILINAALQKQDTLPHEYAHHYINMFREHPLVQEGFKRFGGEEALVQAIGEQAAKQEGEAYNWWKRFTNWILDLLSDRQVLQILTDNFLQNTNLNEDVTTSKEKKDDDGKSIEPWALQPMQIMVPLPQQLQQYVIDKYGTEDQLSEQALEDFNADVRRDEESFRATGEKTPLTWVRRMVGFRIPNQGASSNDVAHVVRFLPPHLGSAVVVPKAIVAKTGSDFDIDKLNLYYNNYLIEENKFGGEIIYDENDATNKLNELEARLTLHRENARHLLTPLINSGILDIVQKVRGLRGDLNASGELEGNTIQDTADVFTNWKNVEKTISFLSGKNGVGQVAVHITNHVLAQMANLKMDLNELSAFGIETDDAGFIDMGKIFDEEGGLISETLSEMLTSYVDIAKDPYILDLNATNRVVNIALMMMRAGMAPKNVFYFINQPIVKQYIGFKDMSFSSAYMLFNNNYHMSNAEIFERSMLAIGASKNQSKDIWMEKREDLLSSIGKLDENTMKSMIEDQNVSGFHKSQGRILKLFRSLEEKSRDFQQMVRASSPDTKFFKEFSDAKYQLNEYEQVLDNSLFTNFEQMFDEDNTFIHNFHEKKVQYLNATSQLSIVNNGNYNPVITDITNSITKNIYDPKLTTQIIKDVHYDFISYLLSKKENGREAVNYGKIFKDLISRESGTKSMAFQLKNYKGVLRQFIYPEFANEDRRVNSVKVKNKVIDVETSNIITSELRSLKETNPSFYNNILNFSLSQSPFRQGTFNLLRFIPEEDFYRITETVLEKAIALDGVDIGDFGFQFAMNNPRLIYEYVAEKIEPYKVGMKREEAISLTNRLSSAPYKSLNIVDSSIFGIQYLYEHPDGPYVLVNNNDIMHQSAGSSVFYKRYGNPSQFEITSEEEDSVNNVFENFYKDLLDTYVKQKQNCK